MHTYKEVIVHPTYKATTLANTTLTNETNLVLQLSGMQKEGKQWKNGRNAETETLYAPTLVQVTHSV